MPLPPAPEPLDLPADRGAAAHLLARLGPVEEAWTAWRLAPTPESLHRLRTATRRALGVIRAYRPWLGGHGVGRLRRRLRQVMRRTSPMRDLDVQLAWVEGRAGQAPPEAEPGVDWFIGRLARRADRRARRLPDKLPELDPSLARARERLPAEGSAPPGLPPFGLVVAAALRAQADRLAVSLAGVLTTADQARAHRGRIHGKRLRYLLEPFAAALPGGDAALERLTALQDDFGELHDAQVLGERMAAALRRAAPEAVDGVKWLADVVAERERAAWDRLAARWLGSGADAVLVATRQLAAALEGEQPDGLPLEVERKYLLSTVPPTVLGAPSVTIRQGYLPGTVIVERLRHVRDGEAERWYRTIKAGRGVVRIELEEPIERALFDALWPLTEGRRLEKRRHRLPDGDLVWEVDVFTDREGVVLAEVELPSAAVQPVPPPWLRPFVLREVTDEPAWLNSSLAR